jgi:hypothetical protein
MQYTIYGRTKNPEFRFDELYAALADYIKYVVDMLTALKAIRTASWSSRLDTSKNPTNRAAVSGGSVARSGIRL